MNHHHGAAETPRLLTEKELTVLKAEVRRRDVEDCIGQYADLHSRHVGHSHNHKAVKCLEDDLGKIGGGQLWVRRLPFRLRKRGDRKGVDKQSESGGGSQLTLSNVEAMLPGVCSPHVIIISAHLDCTGDRDPSFIPAVDRAPGADDDASGMAGVLAAARAIIALSKAQRPGEPRAEIRFVFFNAEEQAQRGSREYVKQQRKHAAPISGVYHLDMIGYRRQRNKVVQLHAGFKGNPDVQADSLELAHHMAEVCAHAEYPLIPQVYFHRRNHRDPGQGFSDHTSFHRRGYPAVMISENFFPGQGAMSAPGEPNPQYHTPDDLPGHVDVGYTATVARAVAAAAWHRATRIACCPPRHAAAGHQHGEGAKHQHGGGADTDDAHHETEEE
jgi:hypothetical protein